MPEVDTPNNGEREFETGADEFFKAHSELNALNGKRTYDEFQDISLTSARRSQTAFDQLQQISVQALQNAVETANLAGKQHLKNTEELQYQYRRHSDLAADSYWNPVSAGAGMNLTAGSVPSNRVVDQETAVAGGAVANASAAVASAVAKQVDASNVAMLAVLQQIVQGIAAMNASMANVIAQVQPKSS